MHIRKATREDAQACWDIRNSAILTACAGFYDAADMAVWTEGELNASFKGIVHQHMYVAEDKGTVIGCCMLDAPNAQVEALFVDPSAMGQGVGKALLAFIEEMANRQGVAQLRLESTLNAVDFYRSQGFGGKGLEEPSVYLSPRGISLDCLVMYKNLHSY